MTLKFITLKTLNHDGKNERNVTIAYSEKTHPYLLGGLEHGTDIVINQELVDGLQNLVNEMETTK